MEAREVAYPYAHQTMLKIVCLVCHPLLISISTPLNNHGHIKYFHRPYRYSHSIVTKEYYLEKLNCWLNGPSETCDNGSY